MVRMPHWPKQFSANFIDLGLTRTKTLLKRLGNPEETIPPVIHVAGTNGKGTVSLNIAKGLEKAGYKTGLLTSPHFVCKTERISINSHRYYQ